MPERAGLEGEDATLDAFAELKVWPAGLVVLDWLEQNVLRAVLQPPYTAEDALRHEARRSLAAEIVSRAALATHRRHLAALTPAVAETWED